MTMITLPHNRVMASCSAFPKSNQRENCESRAWWISANEYDTKSRGRQTSVINDNVNHGNRDNESTSHTHTNWFRIMEMLCFINF